MTQTPQNKPENAARATDRPARIGFRRFSTAEFLGALVLMFAAAPFIEKTRHGNGIDSALMTLVLVSGVLAVGQSHRTLAWAVGLMMPAVAGRWIDHFWPGLIPKGIIFVAGLIFLIFLIGQFLRFILRAPRVNAEVMYAAISVYLLLGLSWMFAYVIVWWWDPQHSFAFSAGPASSQEMTGFTAYYFSFITLTTVGYGDITPVSNGARALAAMEAMTGTLYVAILISRLVALYSSESLTAHANGRIEVNPPNT